MAMADDRDAPGAQAFPGASLRPPRGLRLMAGLSGTLFALVSGTTLFVSDLRWMMALLATALAGPLALAFWQLQKNSPPGGSSLEVREEGLFVEGRLAIPRASLDRAVVIRDPRGWTVSIQRAQGFVAVVDVADEEQGRALVRALGLSAEQALSSFQLDSRVAGAFPRTAAVAVLLPLLLLPMLIGAPTAALPLLVAWYAMLGAASLPARLTVGLDGIAVRWAGRSELIRFTDLAAVAHDGERLSLTLASGRVRHLSARWTGEVFERRHNRGVGFASRAAYLDAIVGRVREAMSARGAGSGPLAAATIARRGREIDAWVSALRGVLHRGAGGFREAEVMPEQLFRVVEDASAEPSARAAAAIALSEVAGEAERDRLRGVARVVVAPALRVALEAAADGDVEAEREALAALEALASTERSRSRS